jgi:hypothetical protein
VETILGTVSPTGQPVMSAAPAAPSAPGDGARTMDPLGRTQIPMQAGKGKTVAAVIGVAVVLVVGFFVLRATRSSNPPEAAALVQSSSLVPSAVAPAAAAPIAAESATSETHPSASASAAPVEPVATPPVVAAPSPAAGKKTVVAAPGPAKPAAKSKANCDPNYYLDAQGEKHFKPECFH